MATLTSPEDRTDFADADRGFLGALHPCVVRDATGRVVWDNDAFDFLDEDRPPTVHPNLWRQARLYAKQGLYEVTDGVPQVQAGPVELDILPRVNAGDSNSYTPAEGGARC
ncbi:hypothetical protein [Frankia gtarii]|uniref:hypothetical protein n=1 Tax=Frankia gtarii TaxID=2950102 RepID=UPI0021BED442|nr:hypothetical protein [Frankia gtarii]